MSKSKLPPLDFSEDIENYEAIAESKKIFFPKCKHKDTKLESHRLTCKCGAAWSDNNANLIKLQGLLNKS